MRTIKAMGLVVGVAIVGVLAGWSGSVAADVITLTDGTQLEGIVTTSPLLRDVVLFSDHVNKSVQIPRLKVREIQREPEAVGRYRIARALAHDGKHDLALEQIREARRLAPDFAVFAEEEQNILRALALRSARNTELKGGELRGLLDKIGQAMEAREYEKALPWFTLLDGDDVAADLKQQATQLKIRFYDLWGDYRADKTDIGGAIEKYEKVMDLDPNRTDTHEKLVRLYERMIQPGRDSAMSEKVVEFLKGKIAQDAKDLDSRLRLANLLYMRKDWAGALEQYKAVWRDLATSHPKEVPFVRIETRLRALLDGRHRKSAEQRDWDAAIEQFSEYASLFTDVDTQPLALYQYYKRAAQLGPKDDKARMELAEFCEQNDLNDLARKEALAVLKINPKHAEALKKLEQWARADLGEVQAAFGQRLYAQIPVLVSEMHKNYPTSASGGYPSLQPILDAADDFVEKSHNENRTVVSDQRQRAQDLAKAGDENFDRAMSALNSYRSGADLPVATRSPGTPSYDNRVAVVTRRVGSYKQDAIMYFERALRYYREALALDPSLADPAKKDLKRKISDCERYYKTLTSRNVSRTPPQYRTGPRYQYPSYNPYLYPYPYGYPYVQPIYPLWPAVPPPVR